nr:HalOD1 output domain-containing protein [Salinirubrum litoreum]
MDWSADDTESVVDEITAGVASLERTTPDQLRPLYEVIDTEALESLFRETRGQLTFEYLDYEVTVYHDYSVEISPR